MPNFFSRILAVAVFSLVGGPVSAEVIKLECQAESLRMLRAGVKEQENETVLVEIKQSAGLLSIQVTGKIFNTSISNKSSEGVEITDDSDGNKWEVDKVTKRQGRESTEYLKIDRNTGLFHWERTIGSDALSESNGRCRKTDLNKRRF